MILVGASHEGPFGIPENSGPRGTLSFVALARETRLARAQLRPQSLPGRHLAGPGYFTQDFRVGIDWR